MTLWRHTDTHTLRDTHSETDIHTEKENTH